LQWVLPTGADDAWRVAVSADGTKVVMGAYARTAVLWDTAADKPLQFLQGHDGKTTSVAISADGKQVVTGSYDQTEILWDAATGKKLHTLQGHTAAVLGVALSADGKHAWTASFDGTTRLWDTASGKELCALLSFEAGKDWLVVTPEGFFDGSPGAGKRLAYRERGTNKVLNDDATRRKFYRPGLLGALYRGEEPKR
jgi:WD40 repeat protein